MYFATNIREIQEAMDAKAPRPLIEVLLEYYPDCTIDRNNRAHAPYDGYICQFTEKRFRAGEYLPFEPNEETEILSGGLKVHALWVFSEETGVVSFEGSPAQIKAGAEVAKRQTAEHDQTVDHVGTVGARIDFTLRLLAVFSEMGFYGMEYTHMMRDDKNNPVIYKGTSRFPHKEGSVLVVKATVKNHWTSKDNGRKATYINRPKVLQ